MNHSNSVETNYRQIRSYYPKSALDKMDELIDLLEMKSTEYKFMTPINERLTDYDRLFATVRQTGANYIPCLIENAKDDSMFAAANDIIRAVYASIWFRYSSSMKALLGEEAAGKLREYRRAKGDQIFAPQIRLRHVNLNDDISMNEYGSFAKCFELLREADKNVGCDDEFTVFMVCVVFWEKWLEAKFKARSILAVLFNFCFSL